MLKNEQKRLPKRVILGDCKRTTNAFALQCKRYTKDVPKKKSASRLETALRVSDAGGRSPGVTGRPGARKRCKGITRGRVRTRAGVCLTGARIANSEWGLCYVVATWTECSDLFHRGYGAGAGARGRGALMQSWGGWRRECIFLIEGFPTKFFYSLVDC